MNAKETLKSYVVEGIVADLFAAEQTYALLKQIGQNANVINQANFGAFFGPLQWILSNDFFLSVARLFEKPSKKYPTRSIPSVLQFAGKFIQRTSRRAADNRDEEARRCWNEHRIPCADV